MIHHPALTTMTTRLLALVVFFAFAALPARAQECPAPLASGAIAAACDIEGVEGDLLKSDDEDCNWIYMLPGDETRSLTVLRTTTGGGSDADLMGALSGVLGGSGGAQRALPELGDGGQASTQRVPMMGTSHSVTFRSGTQFVEVKAAGTPNMRGGDAAEPFCTLDEVEALARQVAAGL